tara:strand:- start:593 stop:994 length:402 start_codon:yes stop_codon:yes gene_type:complete
MARDYTYSDVDILFNKNEFIDDLSVKKDRNAIRQSVINIVMTRKGEKPFNRSFGVGIHDLLFENIGPEDLSVLAKVIDAQLSVNEPRAAFRGVDLIDDNIDSNEVGLEIRYTAILGRYSTAEEVLRVGLTKVR